MTRAHEACRARALLTTPRDWRGRGPRRAAATHVCSRQFARAEHDHSTKPAELVQSSSSPRCRDSHGLRGRLIRPQSLRSHRNQLVLPARRPCGAVASATSEINSPTVSSQRESADAGYTVAVAHSIAIRHCHWQVRPPPQRSRTRGPGTGTIRSLAIDDVVDTTRSSTTVGVEAGAAQQWIAIGRRSRKGYPADTGYRCRHRPPPHYGPTRPAHDRTSANTTRHCSQARLRSRRSWAELSAPSGRSGRKYHRSLTR